MSANVCTYCQEKLSAGTTHMCDPRVLREAIDRLRNDIQELTCGDPRLVKSHD